MKLLEFGFLIHQCDNKKLYKNLDYFALHLEHFLLQTFALLSSYMGYFIFPVYYLYFLIVK